MWIFILILVLLTFAFLFYVNARLYVYIRRLEDKHQELIEMNENLFQSLKELVRDDFLLDDGRLKKLLIQKEKTKIYNGIIVQDNEVEF